MRSDQQGELADFYSPLAGYCDRSSQQELTSRASRTIVAGARLFTLVALCLWSMPRERAEAQPSFSLKGGTSAQTSSNKRDSKSAQEAKSSKATERGRASKTETSAQAKPDSQSADSLQSKGSPQPKGSPQSVDATKGSAGAERALPSGRIPIRQRASSRDGATGLYHLYSADPGPQGTLRLQMSVSGFSSDKFLVSGIKESSSRGDFSVAYTPTELFEVFASLRSLSYSNPLATPSYIQSQGDLKLGAKVGNFWGQWGAGFAFGAQLFSDPQGGGWLGEATNLELHALFTADLTRAETPVPFRFYLDASYTQDNSEALTAGLGAEPSLLQEWGYQSARYNRLMLNFGIEAPTQYVSPFISYHIGTPFEVEMPRMGQYSRVFAFESVPHFLTGGLRGFVLPEVALELGGSLGISDAPFTGVPATPPWTIWAGVTYTLDPRPKVIEREVKVEPPPPPKPEPPKPIGAVVTLKVMNAQDKSPIPNARLKFLDAPLSPLVSDDQGLFSGHRLAPKKYAVEVSAEGYLTRKLRLPIREGREVFKAQLKLKPDPRGVNAKLEVSLAVEATPSSAPSGSISQLDLELYGPETHKLMLSASSPVSLKLKAGEYVLIVIDPVSARRYQEVITLGGNGEAKRVIKPEQLRGAGETSAASDAEEEKPKPIKKGSLKGSTKWVKYNLKRKRLSTKAPLSFVKEGSKLTKRSKRALKGLAQYLKGEPRIKKILVMVHTHSRGDSRKDKQLGYRRGQAIKSELKRLGVKADRVSIYSYGSEKSVASNMSRRGRQRNQRVLLRIKSLEL